MKQLRTYHKDIFIPSALNLDFGILKLQYSSHALRAANSDRYGTVVLPRTLNTDSAKIVEVTAIGRTVLKLVYRVPHCAQYDLVVVVLPDSGLVKTVWLNSKTDTHTTLDRSKYSVAKPAITRKAA